MKTLLKSILIPAIVLAAVLLPSTSNAAGYYSDYYNYYSRYSYYRNLANTYSRYGYFSYYYYGYAMPYYYYYYAGYYGDYYGYRTDSMGSKQNGYGPSYASSYNSTGDYYWNNY